MCYDAANQTGGSHESIQWNENTRNGSSCACHFHDARAVSGCGLGGTRRRHRRYSGDRRYPRHQPSINTGYQSQFVCALSGADFSRNNGSAGANFASAAEIRVELWRKLGDDVRRRRNGLKPPGSPEGALRSVWRSHPKLSSATAGWAFVKLCTRRASCPPLPTQLSMRMRTHFAGRQLKPNLTSPFSQSRISMRF